MRNISVKNGKDLQNKHFMLSFFPPENRAFQEKMAKMWWSLYGAASSSMAAIWDNVEKCVRAGEATEDNIIRRMRFAC